MGTIKKLPRDVAEKIAAGEVVERPASVVKELLENAIDAGAKNIVIDVCEGGRKKIVVVDDGCGMEAGDLALCVERHATSKIDIADDLFNIRTMGFRGEALAAIGAVSDLTIESKLNKPGVVEGAKIKVEGGIIGDVVAVGLAGGTRITVEDLFYNVPARLKFLRSANVEYGHLEGVVVALSLAFPDIRFELLQNGKQKFATIGRDFKQRVEDVLGKNFLSKLVCVDENAGAISINGFVSEGGRAGGKDMYLFLNNRLVKDRLVMHAVSHAFGERLERNQYPACVLKLNVDPNMVDVNVHPTKREVKFENSGAVHDFVARAVKKVLGQNFETHLLRGRTPCETNSESLSPLGDCVAIPSPLVGEGQGEGELVNFIHPPLNPLPSREGRVGANLRLIGQLGKTYVVCEDADGTLILIDQHAAHERLGFDELKKNYTKGAIPSQGLVIPESVELGAKALAYISEHLELLQRAGFEIEPFGGNTLLVKAVPAILGASPTAKIFEEIASELEETGTQHSVDAEIEKIFAVVACHRQVRAGDKLSVEELRALVSEIERENVTHCPHGRPAIVQIEKNEIEKWFKRS